MKEEEEEKEQQQRFQKNDTEQIAEISLMFNKKELVEKGSKWRRTFFL